MTKPLFTAVLLLFALSAYGHNDFRDEYAKFDTLPEIKELVYKDAVVPQWVNNTSFVFKTTQGEDRDPEHYLVDLVDLSKTPCSGDELKRVASHKKEEVTNPLLSPDGKQELSLRNSNIWIREKGQEWVQLSYEGTQNDAYTSVYWSPDSKRVAALRVRQAPQRQIPLLESAPSTQLQPLLHWRTYNKPGDVLSVTRPALFDVETKRQIPVDTRSFEDHYDLKFGRWFDDSSAYIFEYNQRGSQVYQLVSVAADSGKTFVFVDEQSPTFIFYRKLYQYYTADGKDILWISERDGWRHLYRIDCRTGIVKKQLTRGEWVVRDVVHIDKEEQYMIITAGGINAQAGEDPYNVHYYRLELSNGKLTDLTPEHANHKAYFNQDHTYLVDTYSRPDLPPTSVVRSADDGKVLLEIQTADISDLMALGYTMPEVFRAKGRDGKTDIWGTIYRPFNFDPSQSYPVVEFIYAGPHDSHTPKNFESYSRESKLLEMGFIVVRIDGMGTANRSKAFHDVAWRNLKDAGFPDRILWIKAAAEKYPYLDLDRVGVYGYSAGGQSAMGALLWHNDFYKAAVALCGCHDNRMDKISWNEWFMGYPVGPWYAESSNVENAHLLKGHLLIINGELDDNVDPASSMQVVSALVKAGKDFEQLYLPGYTHNNMGDEYITRRVYEFLCKHLR